MTRKPVESMDLASIMADADPVREIRDVIDPPHMRELRRQHELVAGQADQIRKALGKNTSSLAGVVSAVDRYRSPARDALDMIRARDPLREAADRIKAGVLPARASVPAKDNDTIRSVADIGRRVREARYAMDMTQQRFADVAGVGRRFLGELENGKPTLEIGLVLAVCQAAGLKLAFTR